MNSEDYGISKKAYIEAKIVMWGAEMKILALIIVLFSVCYIIFFRFDLIWLGIIITYSFYKWFISQRNISHKREGGHDYGLD